MKQWIKDAHERYWLDVDGITGNVAVVSKPETLLHINNIVHDGWYWAILPGGTQSDFDCGWGVTLDEAQQRAEEALRKFIDDLSAALFAGE